MSTVNGMNNGCDQEMPVAKYFGDQLKEAVLNKQVSEDRINDAVLRILTPMIQMGFLDQK